jgi:probable HAF family extracellular repeat protein
MKKIAMLFVVACSEVLFAACTCFAQMYTVTDLGYLQGGYGYPRGGINAFGQVAGYSDISVEPHRWHAFRTAPNSPINPSTDDLGTLGGELSYAGGINFFGQVVGNSTTTTSNIVQHAFRTRPNRRINPATDDLGTLGGGFSGAYGINFFGQVVGLASTTGDTAVHAFRTCPNRHINPATDDLGTLGGTYSDAWRINFFGQVVGSSSTASDAAKHAFRTRPNRRINPATDDLGTLGGTLSLGYDVNAFGQAVGSSTTTGDTAVHAFRTRPNRRINPATDDLGTLGGSFSEALSIDDYGQVVGWPAFVYSNGVMHDLNDLIPAGTGWKLSIATGINNAGQIAAQGQLIDEYGNIHFGHVLLLTPIYKAFVRQPINADGSSVFSAKRGIVKVKFTLTQYDMPTCTLSPATIAITRAAGGTLVSVDESTYSTRADSGSNFRIDPTACQYVYNLAASRLGIGTYRVDISINGIMIGHAVFALK